MSKTTIWTVVLVIAGSLAVWYFSLAKEPETHPSVVTLPQATAEQPPPPAEFPVENIPVIEEPAPVVLPDLADSDGEITEVLAGLIGPELLGSHFILEQVVSRVVATVDSLDSRQLAPLVMPVKPVAGKFQVTGDGTHQIHPDNADRYSAYVNLASSMNAETAIDLYVRYYPLFQEAYAELGYDDKYFNDRLVEILDHLLVTPVPEGNVDLTKPEAVYLFADEGLEALSAGQKILIRIGPENAELLKGKLSEIRSLLTYQNL